MAEIVHVPEGPVSQAPSAHPLYKTWKHMFSRCYDPSNEKWHRYGARGIKVCEEWKVFTRFCEDMGDRPSSAHTIDRKNNDGDYCKSNCRWLDQKGQQNNRSTNHVIEHNGERRTIAQWSDVCGISKYTISDRIQRGWDPIDAITKPARKLSYHF